MGIEMVLEKAAARFGLRQAELEAEKLLGAESRKALLSVREEKALEAGLAKEEAITKREAKAAQQMVKDALTAEKAMLKSELALKAEQAAVRNAVRSLLSAERGKLLSDKLLDELANRAKIFCPSAAVEGDVIASYTSNIQGLLGERLFEQLPEWKELVADFQSGRLLPESLPKGFEKATGKNVRVSHSIRAPDLGGGSFQMSVDKMIYLENPENSAEIIPLAIAQIKAGETKSLIGSAPALEMIGPLTKEQTPQPVRDITRFDYGRLKVDGKEVRIVAGTVYQEGKEAAGLLVSQIFAVPAPSRAGAGLVGERNIKAFTKRFGLAPVGWSLPLTRREMRNVARAIFNTVCKIR